MCLEILKLICKSWLKLFQVNAKYFSLYSSQSTHGRSFPHQTEKQTIPKKMYAVWKVNINSRNEFLIDKSELLIHSL